MSHDIEVALWLAEQYRAKLAKGLHLTEDEVNLIVLANEVISLRAAISPLADIPVEDFAKQSKPDYPLMGWNEHRIFVRDVLVARKARNGTLA